MIIKILAKTNYPWRKRQVMNLGQKSRALEPEAVPNPIKTGGQQELAPRHGQAFRISIHLRAAGEKGRILDLKEGRQEVPTRRRGGGDCENKILTLLSPQFGLETLQALSVYPRRGSVRHYPHVTDEKT